MKSSDIAPRRMHSQRLWGDRFATPEEVVGWLGALQAQEFPFAKWSVAQRTDGVTDAAMDRAFADGALLRTHLLRPTWHFVLPADIRWMLELTAPRVNALSAYYCRKLELNDRLFRKTNGLIAKALQGGGRLTRKEIAAVLDGAGVNASGLRLGYILMRAELDAVICSGALKGKQHTYALLDERAPQAKGLDSDAALAELTRRYFTARGPATLKDYARWSSLTLARGKEGLEMVGSRLDHEVVDGRTYWFAASSSGTRLATKVVDLVQVYDECVMSYSESRDALQPDFKTVAVPGRETSILHAILLDGRLIGHWKRKLEKGSVTVATSLYRPLKPVEARALGSAVKRYGDFLGVPATLL